MQQEHILIVFIGCQELLFKEKQSLLSAAPVHGEQGQLLVPWERLGKEQKFSPGCHPAPPPAPGQGSLLPCFPISCSPGCRALLGYQRCIQSLPKPCCRLAAGNTELSCRPGQEPGAELGQGWVGCLTGSPGATSQPLMFDFLLL